MDTLPCSIIEHLRREALRVDDEWSEDLPDGFRWWPTPQSQRVFTDASYEDDGETLHRIVVETDVAALTVSGEEASALLAPLAGLATLSGLIHDEDGTLRLHSHVWIAESTVALYQPLLAAIAGLQIYEAVGMADYVESNGGGKAARTHHPISGERQQPDDIAFVTPRIFQPAGEEPSRFVGDELASLEDALGQRPCLLGFTDEKGLSAELPFGTQSSLLELKTDQRHPMAGNGLFVHNTFIIGEGFAAKHGFLAFNEREISASRGNFLGSWYPGKDSVQFVTFVPNALYRPNVITNFFYFGMGRARSVSRWLLGDDWSNTWDAEGRCRATTAMERAAIRPSADDPQ